MHYARLTLKIAPGILHNAHCTIHFGIYTLYNAYLTMHIAICKIHYVGSTMHNSQWTLHCVHCTINYAHSPLHISLITSQIALCTLHTILFALYDIALCAFYTEHCKMHNLLYFHIAQITLHNEQCLILHIAFYALHLIYSKNV